ncbi:MAG: preprotein translocase subunit SecE [Chloroflexia bacterium]
MAKGTRKEKPRKEKPRKPNRVVEFLRDARAEIRRVVWPTPRETRNLTLVVLVLSAALGLIMWLFDMLFAELYRLLATL